MKICLAAAIVLILCSNLAQARENLALHKPYTLDPEPNYPYCKDSDDDIHLTDGVYVDPPEGKALWVMPGTVGWGQSRDPIITIEIDLKEQCAVDEITFNTVAGSADVTFPLSVMVFLSDDGQSYGYAGDVITESVPQTSYIIHRFAVRDLDAVGRHVRLVVVRAGWYCFTDEIEVWGTRTAAAGTHAQGMSLEEVDRFARERIPLARQNQSSLALLRLARERLASEAGRFTAAAKTAAGALDDIEATILARTVAETVDFRRGVPYTTPDRQIGREMGRFRQAGGQLPALTAWAAAPYAPLLPFDWPGENAPVFTQTRLMAGEWGELTLNLTNNTSQTQRLAVSIANLHRGDEPVPTDCISPAEVVFVDGFGFRIIADAIVPLSGELRIPAGMTRQLWLTIRTRGLAVGQYRGVIHIAARGSEPLKVPFAFHVTPVAMPEEPYLTTATFSYLHWPLALKFPQEYARDLREHYINAQVIPPQAIPYPKADAEGNFTEPLDFSVSSVISNCCPIRACGFSGRVLNGTTATWRRVRVTPAALLFSAAGSGTFWILWRKRVTGTIMSPSFGLTNRTRPKCGRLSFPPPACCARWPPRRWSGWTSPGTIRKPVCAKRMITWISGARLIRWPTGAFGRTSACGFIPVRATRASHPPAFTATNCGRPLTEIAKAMRFGCIPTMPKTFGMIMPGPPPAIASSTTAGTESSPVSAGRPTGRVSRTSSCAGCWRKPFARRKTWVPVRPLPWWRPNRPWMIGLQGYSRSEMIRPSPTAPGKRCWIF